MNLKTVPNDHEQFTQLVPGVFVDDVDPHYTGVYIADDQGGVVMWNSDEIAEDPTAFIAAITASVLAAVTSPEEVRRNIENKGQSVDRMIHVTAHPELGKRGNRDVVLDVVQLLARASSFSADVIEEWYTSQGIHHDLLELAEPSLDDVGNPDYAAALDEFEGELLQAISDPEENNGLLHK